VGWTVWGLIPGARQDFPHPSRPALIRVRGFECLKDPKCYAGGSVATGRVTHARQDKGERQD